MNNNLLISWLNSESEEFNSIEIDNLFKKILKSSSNEIDLTIRNLENIKKIVKIFSKKPRVTQAEISKLFKIDKQELIKLNSIISNSNVMQNLILKEGLAKKYWNSIIPFSSLAEKTLNNEYSFPKRIALFPGVSCMFYCGFCGRNQTAKYPLNILDDSLQMYKKLFNDSTNNTAFSISGGLEPLTNPKLGEMVSDAHLKGIRMPIITNGYSLTENYLKKKRRFI